MTAMLFTSLYSAEKTPEMDISKIDRHMAIKEAATSGIEWYNPANPPFRISGLPWFAENGLYRRLPKVNNLPDGVEKLAGCTTAVTLAFQTDSTRVLLDVRLNVPYSGMWHMSPTGRSGFDLYIGGPGKWYSAGVSRFKNNRTELFSAGGEKKMREYLINFPLYNGVKYIRVGLDRGAKILPPSPYASPKRIVIYGGSTVQGACASRPGRAFMNIIGRHFNLEVINLGFSGSSRFEPIMAEMTGSVDNPAVILVEGDRNAGIHRVRNLEPGFISAIRRRHPGVPIVVMQGNPWWNHDPNRRLIMEAQRAFVSKMQKDDPDLYWWDCSDFLGKDFTECTVDGKHPTDLGFQRMAQQMISRLDPILKKYHVIAE